MTPVSYRLGDVEGTPDYLIPLHVAIPVLRAAEAHDGFDFQGRALPVLAARELCVSAEKLWDDFSRLRGNFHPFPFQVHASFKRIYREDLERLSSDDVEDHARQYLQNIVAKLTASRHRHFGDIVVSGALPEQHSFLEYLEPMTFSEAVACFPNGAFAVPYHLLFDRRGFDAWTRHAHEHPEEHEDMLSDLELSCFF